ncbi:MAG TPA: M28 family metallopeptidase [Thermoanaerobaculia bacterium]
MRRTLTAAVLLCALGASAQTFRPEAIRGHMSFLAHDLLEGRATGSRGYALAAEYVAAQYQIHGLEPGAGGSYFQTVPFRRTIPDTSSTITLTRAGAAPVTLRFGDHFTTYGDPLSTHKVVEGDVVFAGFGITAPERKYDDYAKLDVRGKIVAIYSGAPKNLPNAVRAHYASSVTKLENAAAHGAIGLITLSTPVDAARSPWERTVRQTKLGTMNWLRADDTPASVFPAVSAPVSFNGAAAELLFAGARTNLSEVITSIESGAPKPFALPTRVRMELGARHESLQSPNVVGILRGSDLALRREYVVYSAHLDHVGITEPVNGDSINNGALDNASGIAAMLEIARAFAALPERPRRSIIFLATTGEEKGLRGADYFANNPTVPLDGLVANINIDQILMLTRTRDLVALGGETNDIGDTAERVAREMRIELSPDPFPDEVFFVRSDQYPFVKKGIPALYVTAGYKAVDPAIDAQKRMDEWMRARYHSPSDDMSQPLDFAEGALVAEFDFRLGLALANADARPRWRPGDFLGEKFGRK